jgi:2-haloacid dehalogenase
MFKIIVFDAYGTLFDVYSVSKLAETLFPGKGEQLSILWRDKQIEYTRLITMSDPHNPNGSRHYQSFWDLTRLSLNYACQRLKLDLTMQAQKELLDQYAELKAFPENLGVLHDLKTKGFKNAILSNGSPKMLESAVSSAGMSSLIDRVISVDTVRQFKIAPESYDLVTQHYGVDKRDVLFVSSNAWDALGATWFGFRSFWVNRQGLPFETIGPKPAYSGSSLEDVLTVVGN